MSGILVVAEHQNGQLKRITRELLTLGQDIQARAGGQLSLLVVGSGDAGLAEQAGKFGAEAVYVADDPALAQYTTDGWAAAVTQAVQQVQPRYVLFASTLEGKDMAPRVAARLGAALVTNAASVEVADDGALVVVRSVFSGKAFARVKLGSALQMITVRPNQVGPREVEGKSPAVTKVNVALPAIRTQVKEQVQVQSTRPQLSEATTVVSGGRGMQGPEHWHLVESLADLLGAATGASRAAVDAGWRPHAEQVGQTGKVVSPQLYFAIGISGAIQHLAGMGTSKYIVAINKDPDAPIFKISSYGIVADLFKVMPLLVEEIKRIKES